eukprot:280535-Prymnesium_polylepis.1
MARFVPVLERSGSVANIARVVAKFARLASVGQAKAERAHTGRKSRVEARRDVLQPPVGGEWLERDDGVGPGGRERVPSDVGAHVHKVGAFGEERLESRPGLRLPLAGGHDRVRHGIQTVAVHGHPERAARLLSYAGVVVEGPHDGDVLAQRATATFAQVVAERDVAAALGAH